MLPYHKAFVSPLKYITFTCCKWKKRQWQNSSSVKMNVIDKVCFLFKKGWWWQCSGLWSSPNCTILEYAHPLTMMSMSIEFKKICTLYSKSSSISNKIIIPCPSEFDSSEQTTSLWSSLQNKAEAAALQCNPEKTKGPFKFKPKSLHFPPLCFWWIFFCSLHNPTSHNTLHTQLCKQRFFLWNEK